MSRAFTRGRALVVGIADYEHVSPLPVIVRDDAIDVSACLADPSISGYDPARVTTIVDREASSGRIREELQRVAAEVADDETFVMFFSGHGHRHAAATGEISYLLGCDSDLDEPDATAIHDGELVELLRRIPSQRQVVLLDACHSGGIGTLKRGFGSPTPANFGKGGMDLLGTGAGRVVMASSRMDEVSLALHGMANSVFTSALLAGLKGGVAGRGDGTIGVFDLFEHIAREVPRLAAQHPVFKADNLEGNFAVAMAPTTKTGASTPLHSKPDSPSAAAEAVLAALYPLGPTHNEIWHRAGGDASRLVLAGHGAAQWHAALRLVGQGGGGATIDTLLGVSTGDFPDNATLRSIRRQ